MGRTAHAVRRRRGDPEGVSALLLLTSVLLLAAMVALLLGPLAAPARER
jgi:hypothetical protein